MNTIRAALKFFLFVVIIVLYAVITSPFLLWPKSTELKAKKILVQIARFTSNLLLGLFGVKVTKKTIQGKDGALIISNHVGYLDVLLLASVLPASFLTSVEIKEMPFLGQLVTLGGCFFTERRKRMARGDEIKKIAEALSSGISIAMFPEGTSTNGEELKLFRKPFFQSAIEANAPIISLTINYLHINENPYDKANRDTVCWYGDMTFLPHFWQMLKKKKINCEILLNDIYQCNSSMQADAIANLMHEKTLKNIRLIR